MAKRNVSMPAAGDMIAGRYEILALIGEGGGGCVYKARQLNVEREVALKLLPAESMDDVAAMRRFEREARLISRLRHPNTITVYEFDRTADGVLYIAMELIHGQTLRDVLARERSCSPQRAVRILQQALKSLAEAHSLEIVHRDIKPANIMLCDMHGDPDFVKVLDFGVATVLADGQSMMQHAEDVTQTVDVVGTPQYMSPEQFRSQDVSVLSDLYSLGVVAFEMLAGFPPFNGQTVNDILIKHLFDPVPALPEQVEDFPVLVQVVRKLLSKDPADRYQSAEEALEALKAWRAGSKTSTQRKLEVRPSLLGLSIESTVPTETVPAIPALKLPASRAPTASADALAARVEAAAQSSKQADKPSEPITYGGPHGHASPAHAPPASLAAELLSPRGGAGAQARTAPAWAWGLLVGLIVLAAVLLWKL
jgi:serine/threonine protein kinase